MFDDDVRGGYPVEGQHAQRNGRTPEDWENSALPVDLGAVQADDALIDALGGPRPADGGPDAQLAQVLVAWRRDVDAEPVKRLVDAETALAMVARARRPVPRRRPLLVPFAGAAAALVIAFSGVGLGAKSAHPEDPLWAVTNVLYPDYARSVEAAVEAREQLQQARAALEQGRPDEAKAALQKVDQQLTAVDRDQDRAELKSDRDELQQRLDDRSGPGSPASPTNSDPAAPPPAAADTATPPQPAPSPTSEPPPPPANPPPVSPTSEPPAPSPPPRSDPTPGAAAPPAPAASPESSTTQ